jgi:hypothetical protein
MKRKILFSSLFILFALALNAQGNLQFNQVVNYNLSGNLTNVSSTAILQTITVTVPTNKVWKIESSSCAINTTTSSPVYGINPANKLFVLLDNVPIAFNSSGNNFPSFQYPIWLNQGSHTFILVADISNTTNVSTTGYGKISLLEFNIIP